MVLFVSLSLVTITLDYREGDRGTLADLGRSALEMMAPLQKAVSDTFRPVADFFTGLAHISTLSDENRRLQGEIDNLRESSGLYAATEAENERLTQVLGIVNTLVSSRPVAATVIANGLSNFEWTITIDAGADRGVQVDDPVVAGPMTEEGQPRLVGHVVRVTADAADVQLAIDNGSSVAAKLADSGATGLIQGQGQDDMKMSLVNPAVEARPNESVVTSSYRVNGREGLYPPGIVIGQVSRFVPATNDVEAFITVRPAVDFSQLQYVVVLDAGAGD